MAFVHIDATAEAIAYFTETDPAVRDARFRAFAEEMVLMPAPVQAIADKVFHDTFGALAQLN